jgi:very-short-patch-repair endonuclease
VEVLRQAGGAKDEGHWGVWLHQTRRLESFEVVVERGIPVATIERVLLDLSARTDSKQLERIFVQAYKTGRLSWPRLGRVLERGRGRKGIRKLRCIAQEVDPRALETRSVTEIDFLALCREANLSIPSVNVLVEDHLVDFLWPAQKVVVETDSWSHHGDPPAFERDHQTDVDLIAAGYDVHRTTYKMLERNPSPFLNNVRRAVRTRTASTFPPSR